MGAPAPLGPLHNALDPSAPIVMWSEGKGLTYPLPCSTIIQSTPITPMATITPLTIKSPDTLQTHMKRLEDEATAATTLEDNRVSVKARINKHVVECRSTYTTRNGFYVLFYVDDRRTSRANLPNILGVV